MIYLSYKYILNERRKLLLLILAMTFVFWLPVTLSLIVEQTAEQLLSRSKLTPLLIGAKGSELELAIGSLYFQKKPKETMKFEEISHLKSVSATTAIPLNYAYKAQGYTIVGTSPDYYSFRNLKLNEGRLPAILGEAVIGAEVAKKLNKKIGDSLYSTPENVFDISGIYPLKMKIVGVFNRSFGPDDQAIFVDLKTSWVIQGLGHGHQDLAENDAQDKVIKFEDGNVVANAAVKTYNEITDQNIDSFHFHGNLKKLPISSIIPANLSNKEMALLLGKYIEQRDDVQIVRTELVISELMETVISIRDYALIGIIFICFAAMSLALIIFKMSLNLRKDEVASLEKIGASRFQIKVLMFSEVAFALIISLLLSTVVIALTQEFGVKLMQRLIY